MSPTCLLSVAALFISAVTATFITPTENESWSLSTQHMIQWETGGLQAPLQMHLCPGGATDISSSIEILAPSIPNSGSWTWYPSAGIPKHESFTIIIVDSSGYYQHSPYFNMIGWEQYTHLTTIIHSTSVYQPPMHTLSSIHETIIIETSIIQTSIVDATMIETSFIETSMLETSVFLHTSVIQPPPSVHVTPILVTSQPAPIIKTIESPPMIETQEIAPIIVTEIQEPVTKIISQAPIFTTEYLQPIVKTILVTETPAPMVKEISQPPLTVIETKAPIIMTQSQAPIVTTIVHPPQIVTEYIAPVIFTKHMTEIVSLAPIETVITEHLTIHVPTTLISLISVHSSVLVYTPPPVYTPPLVYTPPPVYSSVIVSSPTFQNTTSLEVPTFEKPRSISESLIATSSLAVTTPLALAVSSTGAAASTGFGNFDGSFTGDAGRKAVTTGSMMLIGLAVGMVWIL